MKKILAISAIAISCTPLFFIPQIVTYEINNNKEYITNLIQEKTKYTTSLGTFDFSFNKLSLSSLELSDDNSSYELDKISLDFNPFKLLTGDYVTSINGINIENINLNRGEDNSPFDLNKTKEKIISFLPTFKNINHITIKELNDKKIKLNNFYLNKSDGKYLFNTETFYLGNIFEIDGSIDIDNFVDTKKLNSNINIKTNDFKLTKLNKYINANDFSIIDGSIHTKQNIKIINDFLFITGENSINNLEFNFINKKFKVNNLKTNNFLKETTFEINLLSDLKVNNIVLDIKKIKAESDKNLKNIKNLTIQSNKLNYYGKFSENFNQNEKSKEIKIDFNIIDLNYLINLGLINAIPKPYNNTILKNGNLIIKFTKNNNEGYLIKYSANTDASLKINNDIINSKMNLSDNKLNFDSLTFNDKKQNGSIIYDIDNDSLFIDLELNVDQSLFNFARKEYKIPFNINLTKNIVNTDFKLTQINNKYDYSGSFHFKNNDLSFDYKDKPSYLKNINGFVNFNTFKIDEFNLKIDSFNQEDYEVNNVILAGDIKNEKLNIILNNDLFSSNINYDFNKDSLIVKIPLIDYDFKNNDKIKQIIEYNAQDIAMLKNLKFPQKVSLEFGNIILNDYDLGKINISSKKNNNETYTIHSLLLNDNAEVKIVSNLDLQNLNIHNNIELKSNNLEKFNKSYHFDNVIKNGNLSSLGNFNTQLTSLDIDALIMHTNGNLSINSENGEFTRINTGIGVFLNILNFNTIPNLAKLDFNHIFTDKLTYESIKTDILINGTDLNIKKLNINSGISSIKLNGLVDLNTNKLNLDLTVTPKISSTVLFLASTVNPVAFLGTTVLQKILPSDTVPELINYHYKVTGDFKNPKLEQ